MKKYLIIVSMPFLASCAVTENMTLRELQADPGFDVYVTTTANQTIKLLSGDYWVIKTDSLLMLLGKGEYISSPPPDTIHYFSGELLSSEIVSIESRSNIGHGGVIYILLLLFFIGIVSFTG